MVPRSTSTCHQSARLAGVCLGVTLCGREAITMRLKYLRSNSSPTQGAIQEKMLFINLLDNSHIRKR